MRILFLGTGGGRINLVKQFRSTAGFVILGSKSIYVDPGPGVIHQARRFRLNLEKIDVVFISHGHIDHANDAELLVEALTRATLRRRGSVIADSVALRGSTTFEPVLSKYHQGLLDKVYEIAAGKEITIDSAKFIGTPTQHDDPATGFILEMDGKKIGYTSDTEYFEGLRVFKGCDLLIVNMLRASAKEEIKGHLDKKTTAKLLSEVRPKLALLTRFGGEFMRVRAEDVAKEIESVSKVKTLAPRDGALINVP